MPDTDLPPFAVALLAGGQSRRMGQDKALLEWGGKLLWQVQLGKIISLNPDRVLLSCREEQGLRPIPAGTEPIYDPPDNQGPLPALLRCLNLARLPLLVLGVDMPGMTTGFLGEIVRRGLVVPGRGLVYEGARGFEPLAALYPVEVLPLLQEALDKGNYRLQAFIRGAVEAGLLEALPVPAHAVRYFSNLNTPEDFRQSSPEL
ncbi:molybdenum cofactor guanylyltransferase [Verrucomicrobium sp. BvORR034]|uniref:molybdenum cofactor guanylyltransferase n=1 Tax=Verrucomicrobium sp. BvORR034 TaxID=1396418 RepID=UPI002240F172|nr:molybdenum cofactor guanylyltransferase [Verrucomicrobium sp. BvORR034]